jgi:hypothetical protein
MMPQSRQAPALRDGTLVTVDGVHGTVTVHP